MYVENVLVGSFGVSFIVSDNPPATPLRYQPDYRLSIIVIVIAAAIIHATILAVNIPKPGRSGNDGCGAGICLQDFSLNFPCCMVLVVRGNCKRWKESLQAFRGIRNLKL